MNAVSTEKNDQADRLGILEWFPKDDRATVEETLRSLRALGVRHLRTGVSWADWYDDGGEQWFRWLMRRLGDEPDLVLLPCFNYTPPSLGIVPMSSSPPREPRAFADFIDAFVGEYGDAFDHVELWNEPNNLAEWDYTRDPDWNRFCEMIGGAAYWSKQLGKRVVLGGMSPIDPGWLSLMFERGVMDYVDVVGIHGFPGTWEKNWTGWEDQIGRVQDAIAEHGGQADVWITEVGYSTRGHREFVQAEVFADVLGAPVERIYWYGMHDLPEERPSVLGLHYDERDYHCGLRTERGKPKLLFRLWRERGSEGVVEAVTTWRRERDVPEDAALVTGGAGFVGSNVAKRLLDEGRDVVILDNLNRPGVEQNLAWLREAHPKRLRFMPGDVRDPLVMRHVLRGVTEVYHFAAQVAVTTSLDDPRDDFDVNAAGTLTLLEAMRRLPRPPKLLFTSTNKVYGGLDKLELEESATRWSPCDPWLRRDGVGECQPLSLCSPYGCSKGAADQYVLEYARTYGLPAVVFRMSCIYGPRQFGTEDQGWVAHFLLRALRGEEIVIYGDGKQVRDILYVDDLVDAMFLAQEHMPQLAGHAFNIGGGPRNATSLLELLEMIESLQGEPPNVTFAPWRPSDQKYYVSNTQKFRLATKWKPRVGKRDGLAHLHRWLRSLCGEDGALTDAIAQPAGE